MTRCHGRSGAVPTGLPCGRGPRPLPGAPAPARDHPRLHGHRGRPGRRRARAGAPVPTPDRGPPLGAMGWLGIPIPEDEGGAGLDTLAYAIAIEEIGRVWGALGLIVAAHTSLGCGPLHLAGTDDQKARFLVPMASGKVLGGYGLTEPGAGSDAGGTRTTARHEDGPDGGDLGDRRRQAVHHERRPGGHVHRHRPDRHARRRLAGDQRVHRSGERPRVHDRPARGEARAARVGDGRAHLRWGEGPGRRHARTARRRLPDVPQDPRRRPDLDRRAGRRPRPGCPRRLDPVRPDARAVRPPDRHLPGRGVHGRRHGDRDRGGPPDGLARGVAQGPGPRLRRSRRPRPSSSRRRSAHGRRTPGSRSTAATATSRSTRSSASCATPS